MTTRAVQGRPRHSLKCIEALFRTAERQGARISGGGGKHFRIYPPDPSKPPFSVHTTGYDGILTKQIESHFRRSGIDV